MNKWDQLDEVARGPGSLAEKLSSCSPLPAVLHVACALSARIEKLWIRSDKPSGDNPPRHITHRIFGRHKEVRARRPSPAPGSSTTHPVAAAAADLHALLQPLLPRTTTTGAVILKPHAEKL